MQQWLFVSPSGQQFTANEPDVPSLVQSGQISAQTLMWREGMPQWMPAASVFPAVFSASAATQPMVAARAAGGSAETVTAASAPAGRAAGYGGQAGTSGLGEAMVRRLATPLFERKGWIKLLGVMLIIGGIFTLPAFLLGLILIFAGVALMKLAGSVERAHATGDAAALEQAHRDAAKYFFLHGIFMGIYLALTVVFLALAMLGMGATLFTGLKGLEEGGHGNPNQPTRFEDIRFPDSPPPSQDGH
jgi:hypothetical protein